MPTGKWKDLIWTTTFEAESSTVATAGSARSHIPRIDEVDGPAIDHEEDWMGGRVEPKPEQEIARARKSAGQFDEI